MPPDSTRRSLVSWKLVFLLIVLALIGTGAWMYYTLITWPQRTTQDVLRAFRDLAGVQPRISIRDHVVFEQTKDALELAVVTRDTQVEREMEHDWLGSKKRIRIRATYVVKAGFDLREPCSVEISNQRIRVDLPPPKILSADQRDTEVLVLENGLWNKIKPTDLETELRALPEIARRKAEQTLLPAEALDAFKKRLRDQLGATYDIQFVEPELPKM
jgi:hypothetical protein